MGLRYFRDSNGNDWRVWDVVPYGGARGERRAGDRRVAAVGSYIGPERRSGRERRVRTPALMTPGLERGWLCFEGPVDKRRLTPIPPAWDAAPSEQLEALLRRARGVTRRPV